MESAPGPAIQRFPARLRNAIMCSKGQGPFPELTNRPDSSDTCSVRRILVIDDDREMIDLLRQSLAQEGFELSTAQSGEVGIDRGRNEQPEIVLLDVNLPDISGFEVLRRMRRESDVPVIMLTARGEEVDRIVGLEIGADDYLPKPFSVRELVARINAILRRTAKGSPTPQPEETRRELKCGSVTRIRRPLYPPTRRQPMPKGLRLTSGTHTV